MCLMNFLEMKNSSFQSVHVHQVFMKAGRPNQTGLNVLLIVLFFLLFIVSGCKNDFINTRNLNDSSLSQQELSEIDNTINSFYNLKKDYALEFNNRGKFRLQMFII